MLGRKLRDRYYISKELGVGGFGQTFLAKDCDFPGQPWCVVKQLKPQVKEAWMLQTARRLFDLEASVLARIGNHPQIPQLKAHFEEEEQFYLVQEFIEGDLLSKELNPDRVWSQQKAIDFLKDVLGVLKFIHENQVIHRDLKPENIIRRKSDKKLVLIDFGSVKKITTLQDDEGDDSEFTVVIGTPAYMPVEQQGGKPSYNSDIYALGKIVIQGLSGVPAKRLSEDPQTGELLWRHLVNIDDWFADILAQMVKWNARERYQNVDEIIEQLTNRFGNSSSKTTRTRPQTSRETTPSIDGIISQLKKHPEISRIKKLLFCACKNRWENSSRVLTKYRTKVLLQELYNKYPDYKSFQDKINGVVKTLNKKEKYQMVASFIIERVQDLYETSKPFTVSDVDKHESTPSQLTAIRSAEKRETNSHPTYTELNQIPRSENGDSVPQSRPSRNQKFDQPQILNDASSPIEESPVISKDVKTCNIFDLRYEVTRYTTPLRIKILLFSMLYYKIGFNEQDWSLIMSHQLDTLLEQVIEMFPSLVELETRLYATAKNFEEKEGLTQTVGAILQSLRPFYENGQPKIISATSNQ